MPGRTVVGIVTRCSADGRTARVENEVRLPHDRYRKVIPRRRVYRAHVPVGTVCQVGRQVVIVEVPPKSKTKTWLLVSDGVRAS